METIGRRGIPLGIVEEVLASGGGMANVISASLHKRLLHLRPLQMALHGVGQQLGLAVVEHTAIKGDDSGTKGLRGMWRCQGILCGNDIGIAFETCLEHLAPKSALTLPLKADENDSKNGEQTRIPPKEATGGRVGYLRKNTPFHKKR